LVGDGLLAGKVGDTKEGVAAPSVNDEQPATVAMKSHKLNHLKIFCVFMLFSRIGFSY
jgi:hypothetical protein